MGFRFYLQQSHSPASEQGRALREFMELEEGEPQRTPEMGETALAFLLEEGMVEVEGDEIRVPNRFLKAQDQIAVDCL